MKTYEINSAKLFKALEIAEKRKIDKLIKRAKRKQQILNIKRKINEFFGR